MPEISSSSLGELVRPIFLAWEKLRLVYIVILAVVTISISGSQIFVFPTLLVIIEGAVVANLCYFAGPIIETYLHWLGWKSSWIRWFLFSAGTLLTAFLAFTLITLDLFLVMH